MTYCTHLPAKLIPDPSDADAVHQQTMALFTSATLPGEPGARRAGANILWRAEHTGVLVVSDIEPTDVPEPATVWTRDSRIPVATGDEVEFIATVDAVTRVRGRTRLVDDIPAWFQRKVGDAFTVTRLRSITASRAHRRGAALEPVTIVGTGRVVNGDQVNRYRREGVGRSKAFGCGLMEVFTA